MARPNWEYVRIDVLLMEHPKIEELSDKAFRVLIDLWCYCGRNRSDGIVTGARWKQVPPKVRAELLAAGLADPAGIGAGAVMHDFLDYNRSREQIDELSAKRTAAAEKAAAARWSKDAKTHGLPHCAEHPKTHAPRICDPMPKAEAEAEAEAYKPGAPAGPEHGSVSPLDKFRWL